MPTVSIIIPFFNGEKYLKNCVQNIRKQKYQDFEIILIDDGSNDNSKDIIKQYVNDPKIRYYYLPKETVGVGKARNYGIQVAQGKYIMFVDVDDYINEDLLENLRKYINQGVDIIKYKMKIINSGQKEIKCSGPVFNTISGEEAFNRLCFKDKYFDSPCLYLIKKELFSHTNLNFKENMYHEDFGLIPILISKSKTVISTEIYGYLYIQSEESIMRNKDYQKKLKKVNDKIEHYKNMLRFLEADKLGKSTNLSNKTIQNMKIYYTNSVILSLKDLKRKDRIIFEQKINELHMIDNLKADNIRQFIKKCILRTSIEMYLMMEK